VSDFVRHLERTFQIAHGRDVMSAELGTPSCTISCSYDILKAPAVSGTQSYKELYLASKDEEKREAEQQQHHQRHHYLQPAGVTSVAVLNTWPKTVRSGRRRAQASPRDWQNPHLRLT